MCSLDCSLITTVWGDTSFIYRWEREWLLKNAKRMMELGIKPECEVFNPSSIEDVFNVLVPAGVIPEPVSLTFVMGMNKVSQGAISFSQPNLDFMISLLPKDRYVNWSTMAIGAHQLQGVTYGLLKGGSVRVGMEDNIFIPTANWQRATQNWSSEWSALSANWKWMSPLPRKPERSSSFAR